MARVPFATRESMSPEGQKIWDEIETSRGGVARNYAALLNNPQAAGSMATLGGYARFETPLDPRVKTLAILTAAREANGHYVWTVNQRGGREIRDEANGGRGSLTERLPFSQVQRIGRDLRAKT